MSGNKVGYSPSVWPALSSFASEGEEFERRTKKNLRLGQKKFEHWTRRRPAWERSIQLRLVSRLTWPADDEACHQVTLMHNTAKGPVVIDRLLPTHLYC